MLHAATAKGESAIHATGGRGLGIVGTGATLSQARALAYRGVEAITLEGAQYRSDIAQAASALDDSLRARTGTIPVSHAPDAPSTGRSDVEGNEGDAR